MPRAIFEEELKTGETIAALDGLSWAAWWMDDASVFLDARERAYRLCRHHGDTSHAAQGSTSSASTSSASASHRASSGRPRTPPLWPVRSPRARGSVSARPDGASLAVGASRHERYSFTTRSCRRSTRGARRAAVPWPPSEPGTCSPSYGFSIFRCQPRRHGRRERRRDRDGDARRDHHDAASAPKSSSRIEPRHRPTDDAVERSNGGTRMTQTRTGHDGPS
jgi:hypothetical protein